MPPKKRAKTEVVAAAPVAPEIALCRKSDDARGGKSVAELRADFERKSGVRLPDAYASLLERTGGATVRLVRQFVRVPASPGKYAHVTGLAGLRDEESPLWKSDELVEEWTLPDAKLGAKLLLLSGDGHEWLALCYKDAAAPSVVAFKEAEEDDESGNDDDDGDHTNFSVTELAPTFEQFLQALEFHEDDAVVVAFAAAAEAVAADVREDLNRLLHIDLPALAGDKAEVEDVSLGGHAVANLRLWRDPEVFADPVASWWLVALSAPTAKECTDAANAFIGLVAPKFQQAQIIAGHVDLGDVVHLLEI